MVGWSAVQRVAAMAELMENHSVDMRAASLEKMMVAKMV